MFDIGFWELIIIGVVALLVVGPERLPETARFVGTWVGRIKRFVANVKNDVSHEMREEQLNKIINTPNNDAYDIIEDTKKELNDVKESILSDLDTPVETSEIQQIDPNLEVEKAIAASKEVSDVDVKKPVSNS